MPGNPLGLGQALALAVTLGACLWGCGAAKNDGGKDAASNDQAGRAEVAMDVASQPEAVAGTDVANDAGAARDAQADAATEAGTDAAVRPDAPDAAAGCAALVWDQTNWDQACWQ
jgi:hypothetical protein